ncbi:MAG: rRNA pseudouridine synthase [Coriobacteriia bacterium]|nr:rRNA pseudouridine synthase [Coriobacteriia bacterium]
MTPEPTEPVEHAEPAGSVRLIGATEPQEPERTYTVRLQKYLARAGAASRRGSEGLISAGRVSVNGVAVTELGSKVVPGVDRVTLDGHEVLSGAECTYLALNKPAGVVTTMSDPQKRPTVASLVPTKTHPGIFPVGRLDADTTGLLLFTTDGELAHRVLHPRWKVAKTYLTWVDGVLSASEIEQLRRGVGLDDGMTAPAEVTEEEWGEGTTRVRIVITEGRKRQVRRMFSAVGHPVLRLERISFGPVKLGGLGCGEWRSLTASEIRSLQSLVGLGEA